MIFCFIYSCLASKYEPDVGFDHTQAVANAVVGSQEAASSTLAASATSQRRWSADHVTGSGRANDVLQHAIQENLRVLRADQLPTGNLERRLLRALRRLRCEDCFDADQPCVFCRNERLRRKHADCFVCHQSIAPDSETGMHCSVVRSR